jgi:hypothetical protein
MFNEKEEKKSEEEEEVQRIIETALAEDFHDPELEAEVTIKEWDEVLLRSANGKASGPDGAPYELYQDLSKKLKKKLVRWINSMLQRVKWPDKLSQGIIVPIFKKGNRLDPNGYRPITLTNTLAKIVEAIWDERARKKLEREEKLANEQHGLLQTATKHDGQHINSTRIDGQV